MSDALPFSRPYSKAAVLDSLLSTAPPAVASPATGKPLTVTELTFQIKNALEGRFGDVTVEGEVSGVTIGKPSGHVYMNLKDAGAQVRCVIWSRDAARLPRPREGEKVEIRGRITVYEKSGQYQVTVTAMRPAGLGKLFLAFQDLKERLDIEGLFIPERKRPIPAYPARIGIVTSPTGAAIRDILKVLERRAPHIEVQIWPARVQGEGAAKEVANAIRRFNDRAEVDVLIVGRGGGSIEDLWAFNEEIVARAIFASQIPIISAVGHETDFTIADMVADLRAPTPSAAAEVVAKNSTDLLRDLEQTKSRIHKAMRQKIAFLREVPHMRARLEGALFPRIEMMKGLVRSFERSHAVQRPLARVNEMRQRLDELDGRMQRGLNDRHTRLAQRHDRYAAQLSALNPKSILGRGYSITFDAESGRILRSAEATVAGQALNIVLGEGNLKATVGTGAAAVTPAAPPVSRPRRTRTKQPTVAEWFGLAEDDVLSGSGTTSLN